MAEYRLTVVFEAKSQVSALLSLTATIGGIGVCSLFPVLVAHLARTHPHGHNSQQESHDDHAS